jgi:hypothetical protein
MKHYDNEYAQKVHEILSPLVGDMMSQGIIKSQTAALGIKEELLSKSDMPRLADGVKKGLVIFLGSDTATKVAERISQIN